MIFSIYLCYTYYTDSFDMLQAMFQNFFFCYWCTQYIALSALEMSTSVAGVTLGRQWPVAVVFLSDNHTSSE